MRGVSRNSHLQARAVIYFRDVVIYYLTESPFMGTINDKVFDAVLERTRLSLSCWLLVIWDFVLGI